MMQHSLRETPKEVKMWNKRYIYSHRRTNKEEQQQRNRLGMVSRKTTVGLKTVLTARNLTLSSDTAPNYKHTYEYSFRIGVLYFIRETDSETPKITKQNRKQSQGFNASSYVL